MEGKASVPADERRIKDFIGDESVQLDNMVHGVVAAASLERILKEGGERRETYLTAVRMGRVRLVALDLRNSEADTEETCNAVVDVLDAKACEVLWLKSNSLVALPERLCGLLSLKELNFQSCQSLASLPEGTEHLPNLIVSTFKE